MKHPINHLNDRAQYIAELLAIGLPLTKIANEVGLSVSYIRALKAGSLFNEEIKAARKRLITDKLDAHFHKLVDELGNNLEVSKQVRDRKITGKGVGDVMRAVEHLDNQVLRIAKGSDEQPANLKINLKLDQDRRSYVKDVLAEAKGVKQIEQHQSGETDTAE